MTIVRHSRFIALGAIALLLVGVVFAPMPGNTRLIGTLHDCAHGPIFGALALLLLLVLRGMPGAERLSALGQYILVFAAAVFLGFATEVAQAFTHRDPSLADVQRDAIGAAACLLLFSAFDRGIPYGRRRTLRRIGSALAGLALVAVLAMPLVRSLHEYRIRDEQFPTLLDFSRHPTRYFVWQHDTDIAVMPMPAQWATRAGEQALHVKFSSASYPGIEMIEPIGDWRGYSTFALDLTNPTGAPLTLTIRVHDIHHDGEYEDRFNKIYRLEPNARGVIRIPLKEIETGPTTRRMDLSHIASVVIFRSEGNTKEMYFSRAWLK